MATPATAALHDTQQTTRQQAIQELRQAWQNSERHNLEFGRVCYKWREHLSSQGSRSNEGLRPYLDEVGIPASTAYYWIEKYEISIGTKVPKVAVPLPEKDLDAIKANCKPMQPLPTHAGRTFRDPSTENKQQNKFTRSNELFGLFPKQWRFNISEHGDTAVKPFSISMDLTEVEVQELAEIITLGLAARAK